MGDDDDILFGTRRLAPALPNLSPDLDFGILNLSLLSEAFSDSTPTNCMIYENAPIGAWKCNFLLFQKIMIDRQNEG